MISAELDRLISHEDPVPLFELYEELAEGSFGTVYKGTYLPTNETVALKIITLEEDETFDDLVIEIDILKSSSHPNMVKYFGAWKKDNELFIAMECCEGGSISECCHELRRPLNIPQVQYVMRECFQGLQYMHDNKLIHRDIKGANILLDAQGGVKLADFGVSARLTQDRPARGTFVGTPFWMAPEVIRTKNFGNKYTEISDVWSMGILAIELAEVRPPLSHMHPMSAIFQIPNRPPPTLAKPHKFPQEFNDFIARMLVKDPQLRPNCATMLQHPFVLHCQGTPRMMADFVAKAKQKIEVARQTIRATKKKGGNGGGNGGGGGGGRGTLKVDQRPKTVRKDAEKARQQQQQRAMRKLLKQEMKLVRKAQEAQAKVLEALTKRQEKDRQQIIKMFEKKRDKYKTTKAADEASLLKAQKAEHAAVTKQLGAELKQLKRSQELELKQLVKQQVEAGGVGRGTVGELEFSNATAERQMMSFHEQEYSNLLQLHKLRQQHHQQRSDFQHKMHSDLHAASSRMLRALRKLAEQQLSEVQDTQIKAQLEKQKIEKEQQAKQIKAEQKLLYKNHKEEMKRAKRGKHASGLTPAQLDDAFRKKLAAHRQELEQQLAQTHRLQRKETNEMLVDAQTSLEKREKEKLRQFHKRCARDRVIALQSFQSDAQRLMLAHQKETLELRAAQRNTMIQLREKHTQDELKLIASVDRNRMDSMREQKSIQLQALVQQLDQLQLQLKERNKAQVKSFEKHVQRQLADIENHYAKVTGRGSSGGKPSGAPQRSNSSGSGIGGPAAVPRPRSASGGAARIEKPLAGHSPLSQSAAPGDYRSRAHAAAAGGGGRATPPPKGTYVFDQSGPVDSGRDFGFDGNNNNNNNNNQAALGGGRNPIAQRKGSGPPALVRRNSGSSAQRGGGASGPPIQRAQSAFPGVDGQSSGLSRSSGAMMTPSVLLSDDEDDDDDTDFGIDMSAISMASWAKPKPGAGSRHDSSGGFGGNSSGSGGLNNSGGGIGRGEDLTESIVYKPVMYDTPIAMEADTGDDDDVGGADNLFSVEELDDDDFVQQYPTLPDIPDVAAVPYLPDASDLDDEFVSSAPPPDLSRSNSPGAPHFGGGGGSGGISHRAGAGAGAGAVAAAAAGGADWLQPSHDKPLAKDAAHEDGGVDLRYYCWYHGHISGVVATELVSKYDKGAFLVRTSSKQVGCFVVTYKSSQDRIIHVLLTKEHDGWHGDGMARGFNSIFDILKTYKKAYRTPVDNGRKFG